MDQKEIDFTRLVREYKETMYSICLMFAKDQDETNDLMQEALINLWKAFGSFQGRSAVKTWIWRITMNSCITYDRQRKRRANELHIEVSNLLTTETEENTQIQILHERIQRLKPFDRAIVLLWMEDMSYDEIADIVGITPKNVGVRLFRIKEELRNMSNKK